MKAHKEQEFTQHNSVKATLSPNVNGRTPIRMLSVIMVATLLSACMPNVIKTEGPRQPVETVLILTGAGMVPTSSQDPRYEETWLITTNNYSKALSAAINDAGVDAQLHIKKNRTESPETTLGRLVAEEQKDAFVQVTVNHVRNSMENTIYLQAEFMPLVYEHLSNGQRRIVPQTGPSKRYPMLSTTTKDMRDTSISGLAESFAQELITQGYIK